MAAAGASPFDSPPARDGGDSVKWRRYGGRDILPMWVADMDFAVAPPILEATRKRAAHGVFGYAEPDEALLETVCGWFARRYGWRVDPDWVVFSPGLGAAIHTACRIAGDRGDAILTPRPIYHVFRNAPEMGGRRRVDIDLRLAENGAWDLPIESLRAAAADSAARMFCLCNPENPVGKVFSRAELLQIAAVARARDLIVCAGEVHADILLDGDARHCCFAPLDADSLARTITLHSPSKAFNIAGLNLAVVVVADDDLRARYKRCAAGQVISHLNPFGLAAAAAAWGGACDEWLDSCRDYLRGNRDLLADAIDSIAGLSMARAPATFLAWIDVSRLGLADAPRHFEAHGIGMSPGADFGDADFMRLNFGCSRALLTEAIARLRRAAAASERH